MWRFCLRAGASSVVGTTAMFEPVLSDRELLDAQVNDLAEEGQELQCLLAELAPKDWERVTAFKDWTVWDVVAHLHFADELGLATLTDMARFDAAVADIVAARLSTRDFTRRWLGACDAVTLCERWCETLARLCDVLRTTPPDTKVRWFGPPMKPRTFAAARQMETWAHAWEIYDLEGRPRRHSDRLCSIASLGVRTFGWSFANRRLAVPDTVPYVELLAPSGATWCWNDPNSGSSVKGDAVAFCQVVTQVRNVADTRLAVTGESARRWMSIAQCFAGPPADPPAPGTRVTR